MVSMQNMLGNNPLHWDHTGIMVQVKQFDQYGVKVNRSGRITFRNRRNLWLIGCQPKENQDIMKTRMTKAQRITLASSMWTVNPVILPSPTLTNPLSEPAPQLL